MIQKLLRRKYIPDADPANDVYKMENGQFTWVCKNVVDTEQMVEKCVFLKDHLESQSTKLLYVQLPEKICSRDPLLPAGITDFSNETGDELLKGLKDTGIDVLDLREEIHHQGRDHASMFFRTDHHWKPESGLWAARTLAGLLGGKYGFSYDPSLLEDGSYDNFVYHKRFAGSMADRTGATYTGKENFTLITPLFKTFFNVEIDGAGHHEMRSGSWEKTLTFPVEKKSFLPTPVRYRSVYLGRYFASFRVINAFPPNDKKIVLIHDSFSVVVIPFLSLCCRELIALDLRSNQDNYNCIKLLNSEKPDVVLILYSPRTIVRYWNLDGSSNRVFEFE